MLKVTGERPLAGRKWSRFNEAFTVPQNCLVDKLRGSFNNNVLTITMPKKTIRKMPDLPEAPKTGDEKVGKLEEKRLLEESIRKAKEKEAEMKKKLHEESEAILRKLQEEAKTKEMAERRKLQEEAKAKEKFPLTAARQQPRGTGLEVQYKDFVPKSDWKDQPEAILFTIDLPGFTKEQIKVMYVHASTMIRVTGERSLAGRKWSRFNKVFNVPQNCLANKIHGSFNNNTLTITMPKETIKKMPNLPETSKTMADKVEKLEEKRLLEESTRKDKEAEAEKKKKLLEEKEGILRKLQEEAKAKEMAEAKKLQEEVIAKEKAEARRLQEEAKAKEMAEARRLQEEVIAKEKAEARRLQEEAKAKEMAEARRLQEAAIANEKLLEEAALEKKIQDRKSMDEFVRKEELKEKLSYSVLEENKTGKGIMEKIRGREITSEEKKLMMNVGVSAFVIFALGAYVSYRPE